MSSVPRKRRGVSDFGCFKLLTNTSGRQLKTEERVLVTGRREGNEWAEDDRC